MSKDCGIVSLESLKTYCYYSVELPEECGCEDNTGIGDCCFWGKEYYDLQVFRNRIALARNYEELKTLHAEDWYEILEGFVRGQFVP